jgi:cytochrome c oxidase subunit 4
MTHDTVHTHEDAPHGEPAPHPHVNYLAVFIALCFCTLLSWLADEAGGWGLISSRRIIAVLVLAIAVAKAQFVMRYFMHLKFEGLWKYVLLLPTAILACGLPLALAPDIALHYYTPEARSMVGDAEEAAEGGEALTPAAESGGH